MTAIPINILFADDDADDCYFFKEALNEITIPTNLVSVHDGVALMHLLSISKQLPDVLFLDLNMPRKTGNDCLVEIRRDRKLKSLIVIIFSTSFNDEIVKALQECGANHYIRKPAEFPSFKKIIELALSVVAEKKETGIASHSFVLTLDAE